MSESGENIIANTERTITAESLLNKRRATSKSPAHAVMMQQFGKLPPQAVDLEEAVLGAMMLEKDALASVIDVLRPEAFYRDAHQRIFGAICRLFERPEPVDILTV